MRRLDPTKYQVKSLGRNSLVLINKRVYIYRLHENKTFFAIETFSFRILTEFYKRFLLIDLYA